MRSLVRSITLRDKLEVSLFDVTNVTDIEILSKLIDLVKKGQEEKAFVCNPKSDYQSTLVYKSSMMPRTFGTYKIYAIFDNNFNLLGYIDFGKNLDHGEIYGIIVSPEYRKNGLGSLLLRIAEDVLNQEYRVRIVETSILSSNFLSKKFFGKHGYFYTGNSFYYRDECGNYIIEELWTKYLM